MGQVPLLGFRCCAHIFDYVGFAAKKSHDDHSADEIETESEYQSHSTQSPAVLDVEIVLDDTTGPTATGASAADVADVATPAGPSTGAAESGGPGAGSEADLYLKIDTGVPMEGAREEPAPVLGPATQEDFRANVTASLIERADVLRLGGSRDIAAAVALYSEAAELGSAEALNALGEIYLVM